MTSAAGQPKVEQATPAVVARAYVELTKPRIMTLLLVTCVAGALCAARGIPPITTLLVTALGLALSSGGASAWNHVLDRDIDRLMHRTRTRPIASGLISPRAGAIFGSLLMLAAGVLLWLVVGPLTSILALTGGLFYVIIYTVLLKRTTVQNIVIGGAAGAIPPLVGWSSVHDNIGVGGWMLFAIVFLWTPPHFWALALMIRDEYARASVPMLPVVAGDRVTITSIWRYTWLLVGCTLLAVAIGAFGAVFLAASLVLGARLVLRARALRKVAAGADEPIVQPGNAAHAAARAMFLESMLYLALLFTAAVVDQAVYRLMLVG